MRRTNDGWRQSFAAGMLAAALLAAAPAALAVPSFARQTGMACEACHTVFPELTHFGRVFKANGYILTNLKQVRGVSGKKDELLALSQTPPLSIMVQISDTQLQKALPDISNPAAPGLAQNGTAGFPQQVGLFYAGKIAPYFGAFLQITYSNSSGTIAIDNTDLRFADTTLLSDNSPLTYGVSLNNNPTVQDLWNSTPAFGYPFTASNATVSPLANPAINGTFAQNVAGLSGYVFWDESLYAEVGGYRSAKQGHSLRAHRCSRPPGWHELERRPGTCPLLARRLRAQLGAPFHRGGRLRYQRQVASGGRQSAARDRSTASRMSPRMCNISSLPTSTSSACSQPAFTNP